MDGPLVTFQTPDRSAVLRYAVTVVSVAAASVLAQLAERQWNSSPVASLLLCAVVFSAWFGGVWPGLLAVALSVLAFDFYFLSPASSLAVASGDLPRLIIFTVAAVAVWLLAAAQSRAAASLRRTRDDLAKTVSALRAANAGLNAENANRIEAEAALQRSEKYLAEAQRLSRTGSFGWSPANNAIVWSEETFQIFELDRTTVPNVELILQRTHPEDAGFTKETIELSARDGRDMNFEHRLLMPDGRVKHVQVIARAARQEQGDAEFVGAIMDISEQKWAQAERARLEQQLRQAAKMEAVGRLAGGIAHDFNNVLGGILAYGEMLFDETQSGSRLKRYAQNVLAAAARGRGLVEQILTYSRSQRGQRVPVDIVHVVAETLDLLRGSLPALVELEASAPTSPLVVIGDATQLHQVAMNLCSNAIQAMSGGGVLRVSLEAADVATERALMHGVLAPGRYVRLTVADTGSGMDEAILARIFEPFFTTKEVGQGTGLGLSVVHTIITDSGGAIDVASAPGRGSTFTIYLPLTEAARAPAPETARLV